ncbi:hypothetical protein [Calidifontibacter terrae]
MNLPDAATVALVFGWSGLVGGISFIEAPVKFRAPGVTIPIGLSIGRLVFRVLNAVEAVIAVTLIVTLATGDMGSAAVVFVAIAIAALVVQLVAVRPKLTRRSNAVLAGEDAPRSSAHHVFIALELLKFLALIAGGIAALASV